MEFLRRVRLLKMKKNFTIFLLQLLHDLLLIAFTSHVFYKGRVRKVPGIERMSVGRMKEYASTVGRASLKLIQNQVQSTRVRDQKDILGSKS